MCSTKCQAHCPRPEAIKLWKQPSAPDSRTCGDGLTEAFLDWPPSLISALRVVVVWFASVEWSPRFCSSSTSLSNQ